MEFNLQDLIKKVEFEYEITILLACEIGAKAQGYPSSDTIRTIRLIYVHRQDWYVSLYEKRDELNLVIEAQSLHVQGWDIRKSLHALYRSEAELIELIKSPIVYQCNDAFMREINELLDELYSPIALHYYYSSCAQNIIEEMERVSLKKVLFALHCSLTCLWLSTRKAKPPIEIIKLLENDNVPIKLAKRTRDLIQLKSIQPESYEHPKETELLKFIQSTINQTDRKAKDLAVPKNKAIDLNEVFIRWINTV